MLGSQNNNTIVYSHDSADVPLDKVIAFANDPTRANLSHCTLAHRTTYKAFADTVRYLVEGFHERK